MNILWISLCATLLIAFVDAQRNLNVSKPIINLEKSKPPIWQRPVQERRKLSIFPKTTKKYVVTPRAVVKPDDETVGLPTKRPLMRKFVVQDNNDKGSWYFAPREPLMKTKRFTVTVAPPRNNRMKDSRNANNPYDEIGEESKIVKTVITKPERDLHKVKLNKGNVVNVIKNEKANFTVSKGFKPIEKVVEEAKLDNQLINQSLKVNDVVKEESPELLSDNYQFDIRRLDGAKLMEDNHKVANENEPTKIIESTTPFNTIDISSEGIESRSLDSEMAVIDQNNDNFKGDGHFNGLEQLIDVFVNESDKLSENTPAFNDGKINTTPNEKESLEDIQRVLVMGTNNIQEINSLGNNDDYITEVSQTLGGEDIFLFSETEDLNNNKTSENILSMDGFQSFIDLIKTDVIAEQIMKMESQIPILLENQQHLDPDTNKDYTTEPVVIKLEIETGTNMPIVQNINLSDVAQPTFSKAINSDTFENPSAEELIFETDTTNHFSQETSHEISSNESDTETSDEFLSDELDINSEDSNESKKNKSKKLTVEDISNGSLIMGSNSLEEEANEKIPDVSNNLTIDEILNDSNMVDEESSKEPSNESIIDKSNNLTTEDITKETIRDVSNDLTVEDISIDSNMAGEEISNESESMSDKIIASESILDVSNNLTIEDITNESNTSGEEISNESVSGSSNILSEEVFNDSLVIEFIGKKNIEESVHENSSSLNGEDASEFIENIQNVSADEIPLEAIGNRYKRSNNIIEEEHQATARNIFKYTGQPTRLSQDLSFKNINA